MTNIHNSTQKNPIEALFIRIAEGMYKIKDDFSKHLPFVFILIIVQIYGQTFSFSSEYQFIYHKLLTPGHWRTEQAVLICTLIEVIKFLVIGYTFVLFWSQRKGIFLYAFISVALSTASWLMSLEGTDSLANHAVGKKPVDKDTNIAIQLYQPQINNLQKLIDEQTIQIEENKDYHAQVARGIWGKHTRWTRARKLRDALLAQQMEKSDKMDQAMAKAERKHLKALESHQSLFEQKHSYLRHKVAITETIVHLCSCYISYVFFLLISGGKGVKGLNDYLKEMEQRAENVQRTIDISPINEVEVLDEKFKKDLKTWAIALFTQGYSRKYILKETQISKSHLTGVLQELACREIERTGIDITNEALLKPLCERYYLESVPELMRYIQKRQVAEKQLALFKEDSVKDCPPFTGSENTTQNNSESTTEPAINTQNFSENLSERETDTTNENSNKSEPQNSLQNITVDPNINFEGLQNWQRRIRKLNGNNGIQRPNGQQVGLFPD